MTSPNLHLPPFCVFKMPHFLPHETFKNFSSDGEQIGEPFFGSLLVDRNLLVGGLLVDRNLLVGGRFLYLLSLALTRNNINLQRWSVKRFTNSNCSDSVTAGLPGVTGAQTWLKSYGSLASYVRSQNITNSFTKNQYFEILFFSKHWYFSTPWHFKDWGIFGKLKFF